MLRKLLIGCVLIWPRITAYLYYFPEPLILPPFYFVRAPENSVENIRTIRTNDILNNNYEVTDPHVDYDVNTPAPNGFWDRRDDSVEEGVDDEEGEVRNYYTEQQAQEEEEQENMLQDYHPKYRVIMEYPIDNDPMVLKYSKEKDILEKNPLNLSFKKIQVPLQNFRKTGNKMVVSDRQIRSSDYIITKRKGLTATVTDTGYKIVHEISPGILKEVRVDYDNVIFQ